MARKLKRSFIPIEGLSCCTAEEIAVKDNTTTEGKFTPTSEFKYMKFPFEEFNPLQTEFLQHIEKDANVVLSAPTSSGKTAVIEMIIAHSTYHGRKAIYLSPLKALSNEKMSDWECLEHDFKDKRIGIITGDFMRTAAHMKKVNEANIIIMTSEALDSITRTASQEKYPFLYTCDLIVDESHLIGEAGGRGDRLESAIIRLSKICPSAKIVLLSATFPNLDDLAKWTTILNGKETILIQNNYRPCTLTTHYIRYKQLPGCTEKQAQEELLYKILSDNPDDSVLTFVGSKKVGHNLEEQMKSKGIPSKFYKADLSLEDRTKLYAEFNDKKIRHLVATTGLAWGINSMARHTVIAQTVFGGAEIISTSSINQMRGRAGRKGKTNAGDAWVFLKHSQFERDFTRINNGERIQSQMHDSNVIAFHVLAEVNNGEIKNPVDLIKWYDRTLACYQSPRSMELYEAKSIFERLVRCGCISENTIDNSYIVTQTGMVVANMYMVPEDALCLKQNFDKFFEQEQFIKNEKKYDMALAMCLADIASWRSQKLYVSKDEKFLAKEFFDIDINNGIDKIALCYYLTLNTDIYHEAAKENAKVFYFNLIINGLKADSERIISTISQIDARTRRWNKSNFWKTVSSRLAYGVPATHLELVSIKGIGGSYSRKLYENGIRTLNDFIRNTGRVRDILGEKVSAEPIKWVEEKYSENNIGW